MKKLYLHIGLGKTGSSALQSWLSLNAVALARQGIDYADTVPEVKFGESLSGNGSLLHLACVDLDFDRVESLLTSTYFYTPTNNVAIISCELLQGTRPATIARLREICERNGIDVTVVAYARSAYEGLYSTYMQFVKRSYCTHGFGESESDVSLGVQVEYLRRFLEVFGDKMVVLNYDEAKKDIYDSFAGITGITMKGMKPLTVTVNRSLAPQEAEVLRRINALHRGVFSTQVSNHIIGLAPDIKTPVLYERELVERVRRNTVEDVAWINETFNLSPSLVTDFYQGEDSSSNQALTLTSFKPVIQWALEYHPHEDLAVEFVAFLKEFAAFIVDFSESDALTLLGRANLIHREFCLDEREDETTGELESPRPRFLLLYLQGHTLPEAEEGEKFAARFDEWVELIADHAVGNTINPLVEAHLVKSREEESPETQALASGYSIIEVNDRSIALSLAQACPILDIGGTVEVSSIISLYHGS